MAFTSDGSLLVAREWNSGIMYVLDARTGKRRFALETGLGTGLALSPDGCRAAIGRRDNEIAVLNLESGKREEELSGHLYPPHELAWSSDWKNVVSAAGNGALRLWHLPTWREIGILREGTSWRWIRFLPDGSALLAADYDAHMEVLEIPALP